MRHWAILAIAILALVAGLGSSCERQPPAVASIVAVSANEAFVVMQSAYVREGVTAVDRAETVEQANADVDAVTMRWRPAWRAWDAFADAHATWIAALAHDEASAIQRAAKAAHAAYCGLVDVAPLKLPAMPGGQCD